MEIIQTTTKFVLYDEKKRVPIKLEKGWEGSITKIQEDSPTELETTGHRTVDSRMEGRVIVS